MNLKLIFFPVYKKTRVHNFKAFYKDIEKKDKSQIKSKAGTKICIYGKKCGIKIQESSKINLATKNSYIFTS